MNIGYCPLSDRIYAGRAKNGRFVGKKADVTAEAVEALIHYVSDDTEKRFCREVGYGNRWFRITVEPCDPPSFRNHPAPKEDAHD